MMLIMAIIMANNVVHDASFSGESRAATGPKVDDHLSTVHSRQQWRIISLMTEQF